MKEVYYFSHDYSASGDPKLQALISEHGAAGYGIYWYLIEQLHQDETHWLPLKEYMYLAIAKQMVASAEQVESIIKYCIMVCELFVVSGEKFTSNRVLRNFEERAKLSEKRRLAGKIGANAKQMVASAKQNLAKSSKGKEIKGKERKINNTYSDEFLLFWDTYPRKEDKKNAYKVWTKIKNPKEILQQILEVVNKQKQSQQWLKEGGQFIPLPATYLNGERWNDMLPLFNQQSNYQSKTDHGISPSQFYGIKK